MDAERYGLVRSIIHQCPALKLPQTFVQRLGMTAQIVPLHGLTQEQAQAIVDRLNAAPAGVPGCSRCGSDHAPGGCSDGVTPSPLLSAEDRDLLVSVEATLARGWTGLYLHKFQSLVQKLNDAHGVQETRVLRLIAALKDAIGLPVSDKTAERILRHMDGVDLPLEARDEQG